MKKKLTPEDLKLWKYFLKEGKIYKEQTPSESSDDSGVPLSTKVRLKKKPLAVPQNLSRKERRRLHIEARLDLHGMTISEAHSALEKFLKGSQEKGYKTVLVITGKGAISSPNTLRRHFPLWLKEKPFCDLVVSFSNPVKPEHGGHGAFYVVLKKNY